MFWRNFIEVADGVTISKNHVAAVERVLVEEREGDVEKTRIRFDSGDKLIVNGKYDLLKKVFL